MPSYDVVVRRANGETARRLQYATKQAAGTAADRILATGEYGSVREPQTLGRGYTVQVAEHKRAKGTRRYTVVDYFDVWGNKQDGWEVNNLSRVGEVRLPMEWNDKELLAALKTAGFIGQKVQLTQLEIYDSGAGMAEINDAKTGRPLYRLEEES